MTPSHPHLRLVGQVDDPAVACLPPAQRRAFRAGLELGHALGRRAARSPVAWMPDPVREPGSRRRLAWVLGAVARRSVLIAAVLAGLALLTGRFG